MSGAETIEWESCLLEPRHDRAVERELRRALGDVPHGARYFLDSPWLPRALALFDVGHVPLVHTAGPLSGMIAMVVSQDNACRYCYAATRTVLRILGFSEGRIRRLQEDILTAELTREQQLALDFARRISRAAPLPSATDAQPLLDAGVSEPAVRELAFLSALNVFYNRLSTLPALPPDRFERMAGAWWLPLVRPLRGRIYPTGQRRAAPESLPPNAHDGPFAPFVAALDGLAVGSRVREVVGLAWGSDALPRRVKGLVFAVVARGLGCRRSEEEATRLLEAEGLPRATTAEVLAHLDASALGPVEAAVVPFARETIRYRPAEVQRRARDLVAALGREQFVELVGIAALANMLSRLGVAVDMAGARA